MSKSTNNQLILKRDYSIDMLKFICAVLIVLLHSHWKYEDIFLPFTRCAVPCFLIISGYLLYNKGKIDEDRIKRNIKHVLHITLYATLLFFVWTEFTSLVATHSFFSPSLKQMLNWAIFNDCPFGHHLWYLFAYLYVLVIVGLLEKRNKLKILLYISPLLLIIDVALGKYGLLLWGINTPVIFLRNFLFVGIPYFCIGIMIKKLYNRQNISKAVLTGGVFLFTFTSYMERELLISLNAVALRDHYISSTFLAVCLFLLGTSFSIKNETTISRIGKKDSLYIYVFHPIPLMIIHLAETRIDKFGIITYTEPLYCLFVTLLLIFSLRKIKIIK